MPIFKVISVVVHAAVANTSITGSMPHANNACEQNSGHLLNLTVVLHASLQDLIHQFLWSKREESIGRAHRNKSQSLT
uniref:Uncharacterized protein n=1 Tax=Arundo donax TaxID=35708 RepID=A0A0A8Z750_ARUDO